MEARLDAAQPQQVTELSCNSTTELVAGLLDALATRGAQQRVIMARTRRAAPGAAAAVGAAADAPRAPEALQALLRDCPAVAHVSCNSTTVIVEVVAGEALALATALLRLFATAQSRWAAAAASGAAPAPATPMWCPIEDCLAAPPPSQGSSHAAADSDGPAEEGQRCRERLAAAGPPGAVFSRAVVEPPCAWLAPREAAAWEQGLSGSPGTAVLTDGLGSYLLLQRRAEGSCADGGSASLADDAAASALLQARAALRAGARMPCAAVLCALWSREGGMDWLPGQLPGQALLLEALQRQQRQNRGALEVQLQRHAAQKAIMMAAAAQAGMATQLAPAPGAAVAVVRSATAAPGSAGSPGPGAGSSMFAAAHQQAMRELLMADHAVFGLVTLGMLAFMMMRLLRALVGGRLA